jgi:alkanesulfonate monooxygenase SsuD/methylene tetrahydromethanopterin reductase-like flavin-dependent oxidoreductase (luciferase family)
LPAYVKDYLDSDHPLVGRGSGFTAGNLRELARDRFIIGDPETVTQAVKRAIEATHTDHFIFRLKLPGIDPDQITRSIQLLGREVLPQFKSGQANENITNGTEN